LQKFAIVIYSVRVGDAHTMLLYVVNIFTGIRARFFSIETSAIELKTQRAQCVSIRGRLLFSVV